MGSWRALRTGFMTNATNPKSAVFFAAVFVGLLPPDTPLWQRSLLVAVFFADEFLWNVLVARVFSLGPARSAYGRLKAWIDRAFGAIIALLGVKIAVT